MCYLLNLFLLKHMHKSFYIFKCSSWSSTPFTSLDVYILISGHIKVFWINFKTSSSFDAITKTVGIAIDTSSAWLGPDKTPTLAPGNSSFITSSKVFRLSFSKSFWTDYNWLVSDILFILSKSLSSKFWWCNM